MHELVLGESRTTRHMVLIPRSVRYRHTYLLGRTGAGKSSLMRRMIHQDAKRQDAVIVFDAGDLVADVVESLPDRVLDRVRYFSPEHPIPYNPLIRRRNEPERLENELCALIDQVTAEASSTAPLSARMKRVVSTALRGALADDNPTLSTVASYLLAQKHEIRAALGLREDEFATTHEAVVDRLSQFLRDPRIRRVLAAGHELDFGGIIDRGEILLISLAGLEKPFVRFLGTLFFHGLQSTVLERPKEQRRPVAIFVDEFQDYIASSYSVANFQTLFAQGRRYLASLTVAHQDFGTIDYQLLRTIHGNAGTAVAFNCGAGEARGMSDLFAGRYKAETMLMLPDREAIVRVGQDAPAAPVVDWIETYPPPTKLRRIIPDDTAPEPPPPDPFDIPRAGGEKPAAAAPTRTYGPRNPYTRARKPRRAEPRA